MSFYDFFKNVFGLRGRNTPLDPPYSDPDRGNEFKKPVWIDEYEEEDDDILSQQQDLHPFPVMTDPREIHRYFEEQMRHMQEILQGFTFYSPSSIFDEFVNGSERRIAGAIEPPKDNTKSLRDHYLKRPDDQGKLERQDVDLDSRVSSGGLGRILDEEASGNLIPPAIPRRFNFFEGIISQTIHNPDGSIETRTTKKRNDGTEEIVTILKKPDGTEIVHTETNLHPRSETHDFSNKGSGHDFMIDILNALFGK